MDDNANPHEGYTDQWWAYEAGKWKTRCEHMTSDVQMAIKCLEDSAPCTDEDVASALRSLRRAIKNAGFE